MPLEQSLRCLTARDVSRWCDSDLTPAEMRCVEEHLDGCARCRAELFRVAGGDDWLGEIRAALTSPIDLADGHVSPVEDTWSADSPPVLDQVRGLLAPTDDPRMLGRLGVYEIVGILGHGGMGIVLKGFDAALNRFVAIKLLAPHLAVNGSARKRFEREARAAAAVVDDHVMAIHGVAEWQSIPYFVMPYVRGESLQRRLEDAGPLAVAEVLRIGMQTARGLAAAHAQGLVHRDVKPANILLVDGVERVLLMDFGLARAVDDASLTRTGVLAGTPQYMSPEQARGESLDARSDLFSLGSVLYAICTGRSPFRADSSYGILRLITDQQPKSIRDINPEIPEWLCDIIRHLMEKEPDARPGTAAEVADVLAVCLAHVQHPEATALPSSLSRAETGRPKWKPTRVTGLALCAASLILSCLGLLASQMSAVPGIHGTWHTEGWGQIDVHSTGAGDYSGTFARGAGRLTLNWSPWQRRFVGSWRTAEGTSGELTLWRDREVLRGAIHTGLQSHIEPEDPLHTEVVWSRFIPQSPPGGTSADQSHVAIDLPVPSHDLRVEFALPIGVDVPQIPVVRARRGYGLELLQHQPLIASSGFELVLPQLDPGMHVLVSFPDTPFAEVQCFHLPTSGPSRRWTLEALNPPRPLPFQVTSFVEGSGPSETVRLSIHNPNKMALPLALGDLVLRGAQLGVLPNADAGQLVERPQVPAEGQVELRINWVDLVRDGIWYARHAGASDTLSQEPPRTVDLETASGQVLTLTHPRHILRQPVSREQWFEGDPFPETGLDVGGGRDQIYVKLAFLRAAHTAIGIQSRHRSGLVAIQTEFQAQRQQIATIKPPVGQTVSSRQRALWLRTRLQLQELLPAEQQQRVHQLVFRKLGYRAFAEPDVCRTLLLEETQQQAIEAAIIRHEERIRKLDAAMAGDGPRDAIRAVEARRELRSQRTAAGIDSHSQCWMDIYDILGPEQRQWFMLLVGRYQLPRIGRLAHLSRPQYTPSGSARTAETAPIRPWAIRPIPADALTVDVVTQPPHVESARTQAIFNVSVPAGVLIDWVVAERVGAREVIREATRFHGVSLSEGWHAEWKFTLANDFRERQRLLSSESPFASESKLPSESPLSPEGQVTHLLEPVSLDMQALVFQHRQRRNSHADRWEVSSPWVEEWPRQRQANAQNRLIERHYIRPFLKVENAKLSCPLETTCEFLLFIDERGESEGAERREILLRVCARQMPRRAMELAPLHVYPGASWNVLLREPRPDHELASSALVLQVVDQQQVMLDGVPLEKARTHERFRDAMTQDIILEGPDIPEQVIAGELQRLCADQQRSVWRRHQQRLERYHRLPAQLSQPPPPDPDGHAPP